MQINKREYLDILMTWRVQDIQRSAADPSKDMLAHPVTIKLHLIAIRRKLGVQS